jgi:hypothetical protein
MMLLETYTTLSAEELKTRLPEFLKLGPEVTGEPAFSMYNLTLKGEWVNNEYFCHRLCDDKDDRERQIAIREAQAQFDANKSRQATPIKTAFGGTGVCVPEDKRSCSSKIIISQIVMDNKSPTTSPIKIHTNLTSEMKKSQSM